MSDDALLKAIWNQQEKGLTRVGTNGDYTPGGNFNIFNFAGPAIITAMWGHVRVACTGALLVPLPTFTPTIGAAGTAICTIAVGAAHALGVILTWDGLLAMLASVLAPTAGVGHGQSGPVESFDGGGILVEAGILSIVNATADATAEIDWTIMFKPVDGNANVTIL